MQAEEVPVRTTVAEGEERDRLWSLMTEVWPDYDDLSGEHRPRDPGRNLHAPVVQSGRVRHASRRRPAPESTPLSLTRSRPAPAHIAARQLTPAATAPPSRNRPTATRTASRASAGSKHGRVTGFLEDLAHEPVNTREAQLDDDRAVGALAPRPGAARAPSGALGGDPDPRGARGLDLAGAQPAIDLGGGIDLGARLERSRSLARA